MSDIKWIKITTDIFDDEKILLIETLPDGDALIVIWFKILCLAGKQNNNGVFMLNDRIPFTDEMLATIFRRPVQTVRFALETFESFGMVETINNVITIPNWDKHQNIDGMERIREQNRIRKQNQREREKLLLECHVASRDGHATDKEEDKDKEKDKSKRFKPPTLEEVRAYCIEKGYKVDAERFIDYYESNGWKVGRNSMKSWQATLRNWSRNDKKEHGFQERTYDYDDLTERLVNRC